MKEVKEVKEVSSVTLGSLKVKLDEIARGLSWRTGEEKVTNKYLVLKKGLEGLKQFKESKTDEFYIAAVVCSISVVVGLSLLQTKHKFFAGMLTGGGLVLGAGLVVKVVRESEEYAKRLQTLSKHVRILYQNTQPRDLGPTETE